MAIGKSEWILRDAVAAVVDGEVKDLEAYAMPEDYVPSMRFQDKIKMLNSRNKRRTLKRIGVKVACAVLVFLLLDFGHYIATGTEAIASVLKLISKDQPGGFVGYEIKGDKPYVTTGMSVGYVPEGYSCDHVFVNQSLGDIDYVKKDGEKISIISISYLDDPVTSSNGIDNEHNIPEKGELEDGTECEIRRCFEAGYWSYITFARDNTLIQVSIDDNLEGWEVDAILKVASSVRLQRREKNAWEKWQDEQAEKQKQEDIEKGWDDPNRY